ncbi:DNA methyltransferase [Gelatiniphilus marinus]|uniref:DNA methyltransferase n=1 Tax=Gelatiniphilus marinus TaxID=1759464 RepID=A0ABW5JW10_9FLAO
MDYKEDLRKKLPKLKQIEGFPIGADDDIINLSNPPFYTACPNPYIKEFIEKNGTAYNEESDDYHKKPYVGDVSAGKNHPIYNAHSYHTKVPHEAIMEYINHYTSEGDIVFDGFSGSGMTGVAAQLLNRNVILNDLSPYATFISNNYNHPADPFKFESTVKKILLKVKEEYGWMYETYDSNGNKGEIMSTIWSDVLSCKFCSSEYVFYDLAVNEDDSLNNDYNCPNCNGLINKKDSKPILEKVIDVDGEYIYVKKQIPVLIDYKLKGKRYSKKPSQDDLEVISRIEDINYKNWFPVYKMLFKGSEWGDLYRKGYHKGVSKINHFYFKRAIVILSSLREILDTESAFFFTSLLINSSKMSRYGKRTGNVSGTLYVPTLIKELNIFEYAKRKLSGAKGFVKPLKHLDKIRRNNCECIISTQSSKNFINIPENSIDYIFVDPPFGDNLPYSELSFIPEGWLKVFTNNVSETIISKTQGKELREFENFISQNFKEFFKILKPNRWITIEFHNSKSSVWNSIQNAILKAGFVIVDVSVLDKKQGSFKQVTSAGAVKNDLVISAFKPSEKFEQKFLSSSGENLEMEFIEQFLSKLDTAPSIERTDKMLYSKFLAYYISKGFEINLDSNVFYSLLNKHFVTEDGYWFTSNQINSYIEYKKRLKLEGIDEVQSGAMMLFVSDEKSALLWLFNFLKTPKTFSDIHTAFTQIANIQGDLVPELLQLLEDNFVNENNVYRRSTSEEEHNSINSKREKVLMREYESLLLRAKSERKKIKEVRKEALVHGFEQCYKDKRFKDILTLEERLDKKIIENSSELNDFVEAAKIMVEGIN